MVVDRTTTNGGISISGNQVVLNQIDSALMEIPADIYGYDFQINSSGVIRTYLRGDWSISSDISD
jgi:hypothetical protein